MSFDNMAVVGDDDFLLRSTNRDLLSAIFKATIPGKPKIFVFLVELKF